MSAARRFHILNVFAESPLSGNALAVFEDGTGLSDAEMQGIALQMNLSETTFLFPSEKATKRVRIFTPSFEMPFAGHPTLGTAHVVRALAGGGDRITLEMGAGIIPVSAEEDEWTLLANAPRARKPEATRADLAAMLGIDETDIRAEPMWIDTGSEQLVVRLVDARAVARCQPDAALLVRHGSNASRAGLVYVWADFDEPPGEAGERIDARFFFMKHGNVVEDPGTGSACANLGGWFVTTRHELPIRCAIAQGAKTGRPCKLGLYVDHEARIFVTGRVIEIGSGELRII